MSELSEYEEMVNRMAAAKSAEVLPNAGKDHASIVMAKMFDETATRAKMVVGNFDGQISDQDKYINSLTKCIDRGVAIQVLILDQLNPNSKAYKLLEEKKLEGKDISIKQATPAAKELLPRKPEGEILHFSVFDDNKYRFEKDTKKFMALFCFNDTKNVTLFNKVFDTAFNRS